MEIRYYNPDNGMAKTLAALRAHGIEETSRAGPIRRFPEPVILVNEHPADRISMDPLRDANPFFHFMESLWMLAGRRDVASMALYNSKIGDYSDDGVSLKGTAYGYKWRSHFGYDQLALAIKRLRDNPEDRRIVMTMWDPKEEWKDPTSKDLSCNLQVMFSTRPGVDKRILDMTVTNRSNDIVYGCLGSNVFHFTFLMEYVAYHAGLQLGHYYQIANNLHGYLENPVFKRLYEAKVEEPVLTVPPVFRSVLGTMGLTSSSFLISSFIDSGVTDGDNYLERVAAPIREAYRIYKLKSPGISIALEKRIDLAQEIVTQCADPQLASACNKWLWRRRKDQ